jgi:DNA primase
MTIPVAFLDELRARTTLSTLIGKTTPLRKAGREWKACCPFHDEKSPSFFVNDEKAMYHCFGCSAHGDAIRWLTDQRGLPFIDAVRELAAAAGMDMPQQDPAAQARQDRSEMLLPIMARAAMKYAETLAGPIGAGVQETLLARGIRAEEARHFGLGFAPASRKGDDSLIGTWLRDVDVDVLIELGLMKRTDDGTPPYDFFRGRIMIPIHDARGRVIGFGGRALGDRQPKYLNSPDTPLFDKGRTLYNLHRASTAARSHNRLVIVEGYLDVMAMARAGIAETVAPNGTALTASQLALAWRQAAVPTLCFDGDRAGINAAYRAAKLALPLLEPGKSLGFSFPPAGLDPDDMVREQGAGAVSEMLAHPRQLVDVLWEHELAASAPLTDPDARAALVERLQALVREIKHKGLALEYWSTLRGLFQEQCRRSLNAGSSRAPRNARPGVGLSGALEAGVVYGCMLDPEVVGEQYELLSLVRWSDPRCREVIDALIDIALGNRGGGLTIDKVWAGLEQRNKAVEARDIIARAQVPFSFLTDPGSPASTAELSEAIGKMPKK